MLNTNLAHNILNVLIAGIAGLWAFLLATGCIALPTGQLECSASFINPAWAAAAASALAVIKLIINAVRDGLAGMVKVQPPVADQVKTVVVAAPSDADIKITKPKGT